MNVSIIIPAYNEELALTALINGIRQHVPDAEIIIVDDGSTDATAETARQAGAQVMRVLHTIQYQQECRPRQ